MWPAWQLRDRAGVTVWFRARLAFTDGARVDALAVAAGDHVSIEEVRSEPPLDLDDLAVLADWLEGPLFEACVGARSGRSGASGPCGPPGASGHPEPSGSSGALGPSGESRQKASRHIRPAWPRGTEGRRLVAEEYRAAQERGTDPVLAVMCATGHSRRRALRLIAGARDAGLLPPRHVRR
ncbi:DUF6214 family protein [Streptomyces poonensis]|uniref:Uncharacterized protein n=1 Tax=Streptomyces poonensis TaxID=68255 RepID=A0A918UVD8_9ACTN|nr:DUF6214 family protein [Streptomyces poonensis]GGZ35526.1 hypothetical protein GCM10010365_65440 [Streptomyces poonensis]GLJ89605.1 hypothetical protein GCM10017589_22050 [Streptomyces poonensis]